MNEPTDAGTDLTEANRLFTKTFLRSTSGFGTVRFFRSVARTGPERAREQLRNQSQLLMDALLHDPFYKGILVPLHPDRPGSQDLSPVADAMASMQFDEFLELLDAASLIFAHSVLDEAVLQLCRVTAEVSPQAWEPFVLEKEITLGEARQDTYETLSRKKIIALVKNLDRKSLLHKAEKLFAVCQPHPDFNPIKGFLYDKNRLKGLDDLRHSIVHRHGPMRRLPTGEDDIHFMEECSRYFSSLVEARFRVQIDKGELQRYASGDSAQQPAG